MIEKKIKAFENFVSQLNRVASRYVEMFPELNQQIHEYRQLLADSGVAKTEVTDNEIDDPATLQFLKKTWRSLAAKLHPDRGGDPVLFNYARMLYLAQDLESLNNLYQSVNTDNLQLHLSFLDAKLRAMYEVQKAGWKYKLAQFDLHGETDKAKACAKNTLEKTLNSLRAQCALRVLTKVKND